MYEVNDFTVATLLNIYFRSTKQPSTLSEGNLSKILIKLCAFVKLWKMLNQ